MTTPKRRIRTRPPAKATTEAVSPPPAKLRRQDVARTVVQSYEGIIAFIRDEIAAKDLTLKEVCERCSLTEGSLHHLMHREGRGKSLISTLEALNALGYGLTISVSKQI